MRTVNEEQQVDLRDIAFIYKGTDRTAQSRDRATQYLQDGCYDPDVCCNDPTDCAGVDIDTCDPSVSFCCPVRGSEMSYPCGSPTVVSGAGCEFDLPCGDDGNGEVTGVGYFPFAHRYCWFDFETGEASCFAAQPPQSRPPQDLYINWTLSPPRLAQLTCQTEGYNGFAYANYDDPLAGQYGRTGFRRKQFSGSQGLFTLGYPADFPGGIADVTYAAVIESNAYKTFIPINIAGNQIGYCNTRV